MQPSPLDDMTLYINNINYFFADTVTVTRIVTIHAQYEIVKIISRDDNNKLENYRITIIICSIHDNNIIVLYKSTLLLELNQLCTLVVTVAVDRHQRMVYQ